MKHSHGFRNRCLILLASTLLVWTTSSAIAGMDSKAWKELVKRMKIAASKKENKTVASIIDEAAADNSKRAYKLITKFAALIPDGDIYVAARDGIASMTDGDVSKQLARDIKKSRKLTEKILLIDAAARRTDDESIKAVNETLDHKVDQVVRSALEAIIKRRHKSSVEPLIDLLESFEKKKETGLLVINTKKALFQITGKNLELAADYRSWWADHKGSFRSDDAPVTGDYEPKGEIGSVERQKKPKFFGSEILSRRIVFIIDTSGSMKAEDPLPPGREASGNGGNGGREVTGAGGKDGKGKKEDRPPVSPSRMRLKRAQFQLSYALARLPSDTQFTIIAYNGGFPTPKYDQKMLEQDHKQWLHVWKPKLQSVSSGSIKSAQSFVNKFQHNGATYTFNAIRAAMEIPGVDNIILLSDGSPNDPKVGGVNGGVTGQPGSSLTPDEILQRVKKANAFLKIRIDTFGFEPTPQPGMTIVAPYVDFLKDLAKQSGGKFTPIR